MPTSGLWRGRRSTKSNYWMVSGNHIWVALNELIVRFRRFGGLAAAVQCSAVGSPPSSPQRLCGAPPRSLQYTDSTTLPPLPPDFYLNSVAACYTRPATIRPLHPHFSLDGSLSFFFCNSIPPFFWEGRDSKSQF